MEKKWVGILVSIILAIFIISFINIGISLVYSRPDYNDFCDDSARVVKPVLPGDNETYINEPDPCWNEYDKVNREYNKNRFFIMAFFGLIGILYGLFRKSMIEQIVGLSSGGFLAVQGIMMNREERLSVFIALGFLILFTIFFIKKRLNSK